MFNWFLLGGQTITELKAGTSIDSMITIDNKTMSGYDVWYLEFSYGSLKMQYLEIRQQQQNLYPIHLIIYETEVLGISG